MHCSRPTVTVLPTFLPWNPPNQVAHIRPKQISFLSPLPQTIPAPTAPVIAHRRTDPGRTQPRMLLQAPRSTDLTKTLPIQSSRPPIPILVAAAAA